MGCPCSLSLDEVLVGHSFPFVPFFFPRDHGWLWIWAYIPLLEFLDALYPSLRIGDHLTKQVGEARLAQLGRLGAVERAVVDCLAIAGHAQPRLFRALGCGLYI